MGDAGPASPPPLADPPDHGSQQRIVSVLVLGFGPFKSFIINPSHLIAKRLPVYLHPLTATNPPTGSNNISPPLPQPQPPLIKLYVHPDPILVSYATAASILPDLLKQYNDPDYIFHIGMAAGRDHYALETRARRDSYVIKDVEERDGRIPGEQRWRRQGLPPELGVGWDPVDVLLRWRAEVDTLWLSEQERLRGRKGQTELLRLSADAGKFFCEFILFESLGLRLLEDMDPVRRVHEENAGRLGRKGKVAFLHVPGATDREGIERGARVAEAAIRALVGSWEAGYRAEGFAS